MYFIRVTSTLTWLTPTNVSNDDFSFFLSACQVDDSLLGILPRSQYRPNGEVANSVHAERERERERGDRESTGTAVAS